VPTKIVKRKIQAILNALDCHDKEISVVVTDDAEIRELNRQYLDRDRPTNVIAFPMQEGDFPDISPALLGDVVVSADTTAAEAENAGIAFSERFDRLIIHGILHLLGYDHEMDGEAAVMEAKSNELMGCIEDL
jgi:probable rRNA maturation factor